MGIFNKSTEELFLLAEVSTIHNSILFGTKYILRVIARVRDYHDSILYHGT